MKLLNKKAFTLIELLAVIVILAIVALIATPIVINIVGDAKGSSDSISIGLYQTTIENALASYQMREGNAPSIGEYHYDTDGKTLISSDGNTRLNIEYSGSIIKCDVNITQDYKVNLDNCTR